MDFYLTTWNAQGAAILDSDKKQVLVDIYKHYKRISSIPHLFIVQEAGSKPNDSTYFASELYICTWLKPFDADNNRCTLGFMVPKSFSAGEYHWITTEGAPRPVGICRIGDLVTLACIHAVASYRAADEVEETISALKRNNRPWILGGDMNSKPIQHDRCRCYYSSSATHQSGKIYDYFYTSTSISLSTPSVTNVAYSDHDPVTTQVTLW